MLVRPVIFRAPDDGAGAGTATDTTDIDAGAATDTADDDLGDKGSKALDAFKSRARAAEREAKAAKAELDALKTQSMSDQEKAVQAARAEGEQAALGTATKRLVNSEVRIAAAGKFSDPADAVRLIDFDDIKVGDDGEPDTKQIARLVDALLKEKPYLAAGPQPGGSFDQGARTTAKSGDDMNARIRQAAGRG